MVIRLTSDIEKALIQHAQKKGTTPERLALESLREWFVSPGEDVHGEEDAATLADFLAEHIGALSTSEHVPGGAQMSQESGKRFAAGMVEKRRQERL